MVDDEPDLGRYYSNGPRPDATVIISVGKDTTVADVVKELISLNIDRREIERVLAEIKSIDY